MNDEKRTEQVVIIGYNTHLFGKAIPESQIIDILDKSLCGNQIIYKDKERATEIATKIKESEADFVGLVEVWDDDLANIIIEEVKEIYPHSYRPKHSISLPKILGSGLLMLSKHPLPKSECSFYPYSNLEDVDRFSTKGIAICTAELPDGRKLGLFLTHTQAGGKYREERDENIICLGQQIDQYQKDHSDVPVVVFGDFNVTAETQDGPTEEYNQLKTILEDRDCTDLYRDISAEPGYTYDPEKNNLIHKFSHKKKDTDQYRLDYIFVKKQDDIEFVKAEVLHDYKFDKNMDLSDHYPLQGTLLLKANTA